MARTDGQVKRLAYNQYRIKFQSRETTYEIRITSKGVSLVGAPLEGELSATKRFWRVGPGGVYYDQEAVDG